MKKLFSLLIAGFMATTTNTFAQESVLNLNTTGYSVYSVQIDNSQLTYPGNTFHFEDLIPGRHSIAIYKVNRTFSNKVRLVYSSYIDIPVNSIVDATFKHNGNFLINSIIAYMPVAIPEQPVYASYGHQTCQGPGGGPVNYAMTEGEFCEFISTLKHLNFDSSRLQVARQITSTRYLTTDQVVQIMDLFSFDSSRLDFAKFAYSRTVDKNNYFKTYNLLAFDSSINELSDYIRGSL